MKKISRGMIVLIAVLVVVVVAAVSVFGSYNSMAVSRENVSTGQATIQTQLQRRADLIPNLVNTVKGLSAQEQKVIDSVTTARAQLAGAKSVPDMAAANDNLSGALSRLLSVVENYPEIQSSAGYISLMDELAGTENRIAAARTDYNDAVKSYNSMLVSFPKSMLAGMFGFEKAAYFEAAAGAQNAPDVNFG